MNNPPKPPPKPASAPDAEQHMGAAEDQVVQIKPPTEALDALLNEKAEKPKNQDEPTSGDELTPG